LGRRGSTEGDTVDYRLDTNLPNELADRVGHVSVIAPEPVQSNVQQGCHLVEIPAKKVRKVSVDLVVLDRRKIGAYLCSDVSLLAPAKE
jgi:hypothetical protein